GSGTWVRVPANDGNGSLRTGRCETSPMGPGGEGPGADCATRRASMSDSIAALFQRLTQGVYVVGVAHGELRNAFTAAWVMQVSFDPLLLVLSINPDHSS